MKLLSEIPNNKRSMSQPTEPFLTAVNQSMRMMNIIIIAVCEQ